MNVILDGKGTGNQAQVDSDNRLKTSGVTSSEQEAKMKSGDAYNINTGIISLTSANESSLLYIKNNESRGLHITSIALGVGPATGITSGTPFILTLRLKPTAGTIISDASVVSMNVNRRVGDSGSLAADIYKGDEGKTATGGSDGAIFYAFASQRLFATVDFFIPKGESIVLALDPPAGNTSADVYVATICHLDEET